VPSRGGCLSLLVGGLPLCKFETFAYTFHLLICLAVFSAVSSEVSELDFDSYMVSQPCPSSHPWFCVSCSLHTFVDFTWRIWTFICRRLLYPDWCARCMGRSEFFDCGHIEARDSWRDQIPIFLNELSPPAFRATFPGVAYQLGNVCDWRSVNRFVPQRHLFCHRWCPHLLLESKLVRYHFGVPIRPVAEFLQSVAKTSALRWAARMFQIMQR
jgi:hypothetical protein